MVESQSARIATWEDVGVSLAAKFTLTTQSDGSLHVAVLKREDGDAAAASMSRVDRGLKQSRCCARFWNLPPTPALSRNFVLAVGNLATVDGRSCCVNFCPCLALSRRGPRRGG